MDKIDQKLPYFFCVLIKNLKKFESNQCEGVFCVIVKILLFVDLKINNCKLFKNKLNIY